MTKTWTVTLEDAKDGSGDAILPFPDEMIIELGWEVGDLLDLSLDDAGNIIIRNLTHETKQTS